MVTNAEFVGFAKMTLTCTRSFPSMEAKRSLLATIVSFNRTPNRLLDTIGEGETAQRLALQKHNYTELQRQFGLPAQMSMRWLVYPALALLWVKQPDHECLVHTRPPRHKTSCHVKSNLTRRNQGGVRVKPWTGEVPSPFVSPTPSPHQALSTQYTSWRKRSSVR